MQKINAAYEVERLLSFAAGSGMVEDLDVIVARNELLELLQLSEPYCGEVPEENTLSPVPVLENILDYAYEKGIIEENTITNRDLLDARIMGVLMPRQSEIAKDFYRTYKTEGARRATDKFYALSQASNYIRMDRIAKNLYWEAPTEFGALEITVNLSKPEKDPKEIAASKLKPQSSYPKCLLCVENIGFPGHINHPARQNHRVIPVKLQEEQWYLQYSPYVYYNEHCILFYEKHKPMKISDMTFRRLFSFVEQFPHYFIGSNADLPIVGGSILSHEHFQGGRHVFPMETAQVETSFKNESYPGVKGAVVSWPMSVIRLSSKNKEELIKLSIEILKLWREYSDAEACIFAYTEIQKEKVPHNTITPISRINNNGEFEIDLVLRNNKTSQEHPLGIFHPHEELHHIKKENIGLIEVMGLAVLPARLNEELKEIEPILQGDLARLAKAELEPEDTLNKHADWIKSLIEKYGSNCTAEKSKEVIKKEVGIKFLQVLMDAAVFKRNDQGKAAFERFMREAGFTRN